MIYRINEGASKLARDVMDPLRKLRTDFAALEAAHEKMTQAKDSAFGTLSVRSDDVSGAVTLNEGHGIESGVMFDLFWAGGARAGVVAGVVDGQNVPFVGGSGDNLPSASTAVTVAHYTTLAAEMKIVDASGEVSPTDAYGVFNELASMLLICNAAIKQCAARLVNYNG
jgi:hypothetical protein